MMPKANMRYKPLIIKVMSCRMFKKYTKKVLSKYTPVFIYEFKMQKISRLTMMYIFYTPVE
jgi:hypothetical protein